MSLYVTLTINDEPIGSVAITRQHDDNGTNHDSVNAYGWTYHQGGQLVGRGITEHRYGDGAVVLASTVMSELADRIGGAA